MFFKNKKITAFRCSFRYAQVRKNLDRNRITMLDQAALIKQHTQLINIELSKEVSSFVCFYKIIQKV